MPTAAPTRAPKKATSPPVTISSVDQAFQDAERILFSLAGTSGNPDQKQTAIFRSIGWGESKVSEERRRTQNVWRLRNTVRGMAQAERLEADTHEAFKTESPDLQKVISDAQVKLNVLRGNAEDAARIAAEKRKAKADLLQIEMMPPLRRDELYKSIRDMGPDRAAAAEAKHVCEQIPILLGYQAARVAASRETKFLSHGQKDFILRTLYDHGVRDIGDLESASNWVRAKTALTELLPKLRDRADELAAVAADKEDALRAELEAALLPTE